MACQSCDRGWDHCHETLLEHRDGTFECPDGRSCAHDPLTHEWRRVCAAAGPACPCAPGLPGDRSAGALRRVA